MMRSYDGYRALVVLATILAHMTGTLTVRITGNKQTNKRSSGESSSALILSLSLFPHLMLFFRFRYLVYLVYLFRCTRKRSLPLSSRSRAARCASFILPPVSSSFALFVQTRCRVHHPRSLCVWSLFYTLFSSIHRILNISSLYSIFIPLFSFTFSFPLARFSLSCLLLNCCSIFSLPLFFYFLFF